MKTLAEQVLVGERGGALMRWNVCRHYGRLFAVISADAQVPQRDRVPATGNDASQVGERRRSHQLMVKVAKECTALSAGR